MLEKKLDLKIGCNDLWNLNLKGADYIPDIFSGYASEMEDSKWEQFYQNRLLKDVEKLCSKLKKDRIKRVAIYPPPTEDKENRKGKRGPVKRSKSRNLLERLINYEQEVLGFMTDESIPFTNNQGERDLRMSKVQQKISGCFRSMQGAFNFARIRSYISTCIKNGMSSTEALNLAVQGDLPSFMKEALR